MHGRATGCGCRSPQWSDLEREWEMPRSHHEFEALMGERPAAGYTAPGLARLAGGPGVAMARVGVVGAGAAGIAAARRLVAAGHDVVVLEARERIGGRTWSDTSLANHPVELGAEFIHGERVATWRWVRELGARTTGAAHAYEQWFHLGGRLVDAEAALEAFGTEPLTAIGRLTELWRERGLPEGSLDRVLELWPEISARPLTEERRRVLANYVAELSASDLEDLGTHRAAPNPDEPPEALRHFRLLDGYTALMSSAAKGLNVRLGAPVTTVRWDENGAEVEAGDRVERLDRVVVTLPLGVLKRGVVRFEPELPAEKRGAIERLNAGHISKVVLRLDRVYWPPEMTFLWTPLSTQLWWRPGQGQAEEAPVITAFFGGRDAAALEGASEAEAIEEATRQLESIIGESLNGRVEAGRYVAWGHEEYTWMGYSSMPPGGRGLRQTLAAPAGALHFAGEATNAAHPATVHGAIASGERAADEVIEAVPGRG